MQLGGVRSSSPVANSFIAGTVDLNAPRYICLSVIMVNSKSLTNEKSREKIQREEVKYKLTIVSKITSLN